MKRDWGALECGEASPLWVPDFPEAPDRQRSLVHELVRPVVAADPPPLLPRLCRRPRLARPGVAAFRRQAPGRREVRPGPDGAEAAALPGEGEERYLPLHGRRPEPAGAVGLEAEASRDARPAHPRV